MKLQLSDNRAKALAKVAGPYTSMADSAHRVLDAFVKEGHDPFTRRDICAVLTAMGGPADPINDLLPSGEEGWRILNPIYKACTAMDRGFYTQKGGSPSVRKNTPIQYDSSVQQRAGLSWVPAQFQIDPDLEGYYGEDVGLRRMAAAASDCFGNHSAKASPCQVCPLARFCQKASLSAFADIAAALDAETENILRNSVVALPAQEPAEALEPETLGDWGFPPEKPVSVPPSFPETSTIPMPTGPPTGMSTTELLDQKFGVGKVDEVPLPFEGVCSHCDQILPQGLKAVHIRGKGMMHSECALKLP